MEYENNTFTRVSQNTLKTFRFGVQLTSLTINVKKLILSKHSTAYPHVEYMWNILTKYFPNQRLKNKTEGYSNKAAARKPSLKDSGKNLQHQAKKLTRLYILSSILRMIIVNIKTQQMLNREQMLDNERNSVTFITAYR